MTVQAQKRFLFVGILTGVITACLGLETQHSNHLGWALLFAGAAVTTGGSIYLGALFLQAGAKKPDPGGSLWLPLLGVLIISLVTPLEYLFLPPILPRSDHTQDIGMILFAGGLAFYLLSLKSPGPWEGAAAAMRGRQPVPLAAALRVIFCPISASLLLFALGLGIGYSSLGGLLVIAILVLPGLWVWLRSIGKHAHAAG